MSWSALSLAEPISPAPSNPPNLRVLSVSPFDPMVREGSANNSWLSFPNAVEAVISKLDIKQGEAVFAMAVAAASYGDFAAQLAALDAVFPLKLFKKWQRHASRLKTLELDKFALIDSIAPSLSAPMNQLATVRERVQKALAVQGLTDANVLKASNPLQNLTDFEAAKSAFDALTNTPIPSASGGVGWRLYAESDVNDALRTSAPGANYTLTAISVFVGTPAELAYLTELMP